MSLAIARTILRKFSASRELGFDLGDRGPRVLGDIVQQTGDDRRDIHAHFCKDAGDLERVREVGLARGAQLAAVGDRRVDVGAFDGFGVGLGVVGQHEVDDLADPVHNRSAPPFTCRAIVLG
jgi:hypothetical protein